MSRLAGYVPIDRRQALAQGADLPEYTAGAVLFADLAGFTPMTEMLMRLFGPQRGAEELLLLLNQVYEALVEQADRYGGSIVTIAGDALTVWFPGDAPGDQHSATARATGCALAMQPAADLLRRIPAASSQTMELGLKTTIAAGPVRRFLAGDPAIQVIEVLAGATLVELAAAAEQTRAGEVVLAASARQVLADQVQVAELRAAGGSAGGCVVIAGLAVPAELRPWPTLPDAALPDEQLRPWLPPPVYERLRGGQGEFLTELRYAIALFLRFADLDYDHDPTAASRLDGFVRWVQQVLARYQGSLMQISIGDKGSYLYVVFGAPIAHGDDAARAVAAALELAAPPPEQAHFGPVQIGISGGQARIGAVGGSTRTYTVMGDAVNLAARLMEQAAPGQVLVSSNLVQPIGRRYRLEPLPPLAIKGKTDPIPVVVATKWQSDLPAALQEPQYGLELIGRTAEQAQIDEQIATVARGEGRIIGITGEAGMGKSRLAAELIRRARAAGFLISGGVALSTTTQTSYYAWRPVWHLLFRLDLAAPPSAQIAALEQSLAALNPALLPKLPLLGPLLNLPLPDNSLTATLEPRQRKELLEELLVTVLSAWLAQPPAPLLLVLEDAQWLDALSLDLLRAVGRALPRLPLLLVLTYRPPVDDLPFRWPFADLPHSREIALSELPASDAATLIAQKAALLYGPHQQLSAAFVNAVIDRTEGNPFYIEELLNYLHSCGVAPDDQAAFERLSLPDSLSSLILSRIDRLTTDQQMIVKVASVIGRWFPVAWLWGVHPGIGPEVQVRRDLEIVTRLDITALNMPDPELAYVFKHVLTQEVPYASLPFALRARLHEQLAAWLEQQAQIEASVDLLAYHYGRSGNSAKQCEYFRKAGDAARTRFANAAALQYYERLLVLCPPEEHAAIHLTIASIYKDISAWERAEAHYRAVLALETGQNLASLHAQALLGLGKAMTSRGFSEEAIAWLGLARRSFDALGDTAGMVTALLALTGEYWLHGKLEQAEAMIGEALDLYGIDQSNRALLYHMLGNLALSKRDYATAYDYWFQSRLIHQTEGRPLAAARLNVNIAMVAYHQNDYDTAHSLVSASLQDFRVIGALWEVVLAQVVLGLVMSARGETYAALRLQAENVERLIQIETEVGLDACLLGLAVAVQQDRQTPEAHSLAVNIIATASNLLERRNARRDWFYQQFADAVAGQARASLGLVLFEQAWSEAAGWGLDQIWNQTRAYLTSYEL
ncbi:MAG: adenylate/guanylate cyclase domain-containing protein [Roseiflexaceae bacterium]